MNPARINRELDARIASARTQIDGTKTKAAALLKDAQAKLAEAETRAATAPEAFRRSFDAEIRARRYLCEMFANLAA